MIFFIKNESTTYKKFTSQMFSRELNDLNIKKEKKLHLTNSRQLQKNG